MGAAPLPPPPPPPPAAASPLPLLLLLLLLASLPPPPSASAWPPPRILRLFPEVSRAAQRFSAEGASNFSLFQADSHTLYVGARDAVFALTLGSIGQRPKKISWMVTKAQRDACTQKGKKEAECQNFIRILQFVNQSHLFVCGTFAFDPRCGYIKLSDFRSVEHVGSGRGHCPFEPLQPSTAIMADGALYVATVGNFLGTDPLISRVTGNPPEVIRTDGSMNWLNDPEFVASAFLREGKDGEDDKIYFFFTETAREYDFFEKVKVARVARVCKGDLGGQRTLQKRWTTFLKAQLHCSDPKSGTVFNVLRDVVTLPAQDGAWDATIFYGVFAAQGREESGSAVCTYNVEAIRRAMEGRFKEFRRECDKWTPLTQSDVPHLRPGACVTSSTEGIGSSLALPDHVLTFVRDHPLMDEPVLPLDNTPVLVAPGTRYLRLAIHRVAALSGQEHHVLFLGTEDGRVHKAVRIGSRLSLLEDLHLFAEPQPIRNLQLHQNWLYVASDTEVTQIPTSTCHAYKSCQDCLLSKDPACAWSRDLGACREHRGQTGLIQDLAAVNIPALCPTEKTEVPSTVEVPELPSARVVLPCNPRSSWSKCEWQMPPQEASAYIVRRDGLELFAAGAATVPGEYVCRCAESGVGGVVASYRVVGSAGVLCATKSAERSYGVLVGLLCFALGLAVSGGCLLLCERRRRERLRRELLCRERNGLDLMPSTATSCSHEPQTPSSPEDERHPLATGKKNGGCGGGGLNGFPHLYVSELDSAEQARIYLTGVPLAKCDETSI